MCKTWRARMWEIVCGRVDEPLRRLGVTVHIPAETHPLAREALSPTDDSRVTLGYEYLRKLCSQASFNCTLIGRHADGGGLDTKLHVNEKLDAQSRSSDFSLEFQLRVTSRGLPVVDSKLLFSLEVERYEILRSTAAETPRFLVLLTLPAEFDGDVAPSAEDHIAERRGRWLCLSGAPQASGTTATPVRFPTWNVLTPAALREIARRVSLGLRFFHEQTA